MNDFADRFSPIVVKELRQGMRSKAFVTTFLLLQVFMIFCVLSSLGEDSRTGASSFFWTVTGAALLVGVPFRGLASLSGEIKNNTMELLLLTQLSSWRIVAGKWAALFSQSLLMVCAVLPYVVLRYFLGRIDLVAEMITLGWMLFGSALLSSVAVGFSPFTRSALGGLMMYIGIGFSVQMFFVLFLGRGILGGVVPPPRFWVLMVLVFGALSVLEVFELAAGKIAPTGENHTTRKRLLAAAILLIAAVLGWSLNARGAFAFLAAFLVAPICLGALTEESPEVPILYRPIWPFTRHSFVARLAGKFLYPGWAPGLLFNALVIAVLLGLAGLKAGDSMVNYRILAGIGGLLMPLVLVRLFFAKRVAFPIYVGFQVLFIVFAIVLSSATGTGANLSFASVVPTTGVFVSFWRSSDFQTDLTWHFIFTGMVTAVSLLILLGLSVRQWKKLKALEREAAALVSTPVSQ